MAQTDHEIDKLEKLIGEPLSSTPPNGKDAQAAASNPGPATPNMKDMLKKKVEKDKPLSQDQQQPDNKVLQQ